MERAGNVEKRDGQGLGWGYIMGKRKRSWGVEGVSRTDRKRWGVDELDRLEWRECTEKRGEWREVGCGVGEVFREERGWRLEGAHGEKRVWGVKAMNEEGKGGVWRVDRGEEWRECTKKKHGLKVRECTKKKHG